MRNRELQKQRQREWYLRKRKDKSWLKRKSSINKKWKYSNKEYIKMYQQNYLDSNPWIKTYKYIQSRCNNKKHKAYKNYGGKGIKNLMRPEDLKTLWFKYKAYNLKKPSIDRKDPSKNYTINNCIYIELLDNISKTWFK